MKRSIVHVGAATFATLVIVLSGSASAFAAPAPAAGAAYIDGSTGSSTGSAQGLPAIARGFVCLLKTMSGGVGSICTV